MKKTEKSTDTIIMSYAVFCRNPSKVGGGGEKGVVRVLPTTHPKPANAARDHFCLLSDFR